MKKFYNTPCIKVTTYITVDSTNGLVANTSDPIAAQYKGTGEIGSGTYKLNELNS